MLHNQPPMKLVSSAVKSIALDFDDRSSLDPAKEQHRRSLLSIAVVLSKAPAAAGGGRPVALLLLAGHNQDPPRPKGGNRHGQHAVFGL